MLDALEGHHDSRPRRVIDQLGQFIADLANHHFVNDVLLSELHERALRVLDDPNKALLRLCHMEEVYPCHALRRHKSNIGSPKAPDDGCQGSEPATQYPAPGDIC